MANISEYMAGVKSVQRGVISIAAANLTATATVTAVDTTKTELRLLGVAGNFNEFTSAGLAYVQLTNGTTITATRASNSWFNGSSWTTGSLSVSFELTEFN